MTSHRPEPGEHSTIPPRPAGGGNIDCKELVAGTTLFLPVTVPGGLLTWATGTPRRATARSAGPPSNAR